MGVGVGTKVLGSCDPQSCLRQLNARDQVIDLLYRGVRVVVPIERSCVIVEPFGTVWVCKCRLESCELEVIRVKSLTAGS